MNKEKFNALIQKVNTSDSEYKLEDLDNIENGMMSFANYVNVVYNQVTMTPIIYAKYEGEELQHKIETIDSRRRTAHEKAIVSCSLINKLCDYYGAEKICPDTNDRNIIANFCAQVTTEFFLDGIGKDRDTIDKVVETMQRENKQIDLDHMSYACVINDDFAR